MNSIAPPKRPTYSVSTTGCIVLAILLSITLATTAYFLWAQDNNVTRENGPIENSQAVFLALAFALHIRQRRQLPRHAAQSTTDKDIIARVCHLTLAMLALSILVRELDIDKLGASPAWHWLEITIRTAGVGAWMVVLVSVFHQRSALWAHKWVILRTVTSILTGIGVALYISSWFFDKSVVPIHAAASQLWEESLQASGTIFIVSAALRRIEL